MVNSFRDRTPPFTYTNAMPHPSASALRIVAACVFGSSARGEMRPFSDVDLGLLLPDEPDLMDLGELAGRVEEICHRPVDIVSLRGG